MLIINNTPRLSEPGRQRRTRALHAVLLDADISSLPLSCLESLYSSPLEGVIAWERAERAFCFDVHPYDEFAWRLTNRWIHCYSLPTRLRKHLVTGPDGAALHEFELSFIGEETPLVPTPEQVRFV